MNFFTVCYISLLHTAVVREVRRGLPLCWVAEVKQAQDIRNDAYGAEC